MKCLNCGRDMVPGSVEGVNQGGGSFYEFTADEEKKKKGIKGFFSRERIPVSTTIMDQPAWYCPDCKRILMWMEAKE